MKPVHKSGEKRMDPMITPSFLDDKSKGFVYFQDQKLSVSESIQIHLKPSTGISPGCMMCMFMLDCILSVMFYFGHVYYFLAVKIKNESDHLLHILLGVGFSNIILFYAFTDGVRFLRSNFDKILYLISCLM